MTLATNKKNYTFAEYLELEKTANCKHEYQNGAIIPMTGGTTNHNKIAGNFYFYFRLKCKQQNYKIFIGDVKLWIPRYQQATYPDVMIVEGEPIYYLENQTTVTNPLLIVEVLSKSTQNYDLGNKFLYYRSLSQFQEYILIGQNQHYVMQYNKTHQGKWLLTEYEREDSILPLISVNLEVTFSELYEGVIFNGEND